MTFIIIIIEVRVTKLCFYLSILEDDIFRTLERIESSPAYFTTLTQGDRENICIIFLVTCFVIFNNLTLYTVKD